jgi:F420H(2)-dependent quinone reductase
MKHRIVHTLQSVLNPPIKLALAVGLPLPGYALLETKGRKTGKPRRTPVGDGRIGNVFWLVAEHGMKAGYVRNIERDSCLRLKLREGLKYAGALALHICSLTMILVSANAGWRLSCQAVPEMQGRFGFSGRNSSPFELI